MAIIKENNNKICVCTNFTRRTSKTFDTYKDLLNWTKEQIEKESEIKSGDEVKIIDEGKMYTSLDYDFFINLYWDCDEIEDMEQLVKIVRHYQYKPYKPYDGLNGKVICEYDNKYLILILSDNYRFSSEYIVIGKEGVKKINA